MEKRDLSITFRKCTAISYNEERQCINFESDPKKGYTCKYWGPNAACLKEVKADEEFTK